MNTITKEQAKYYWEYYMATNWELNCYVAMPKFFEGFDNLHNDEVAKKCAFES